MEAHMVFNKVKLFRRTRDGRNSLKKNKQNTYGQWTHTVQKYTFTCVCQFGVFKKYTVISRTNFVFTFFSLENRTYCL